MEYYPFIKVISEIGPKFRGKPPTLTWSNKKPGFFKGDDTQDPSWKGVQDAYVSKTSFPTVPACAKFVHVKPFPKKNLISKKQTTNTDAKINSTNKTDSTPHKGELELCVYNIYIYIYTYPWKSNHHVLKVTFRTTIILVGVYHLPKGTTIFKMVVDFQGIGACFTVDFMKVKKGGTLQ